MKSDWIDADTRAPKEGECVLLPDFKPKYVVHGPALYNNKGQIAIPVSLVKKYKLVTDE